MNSRFKRVDARFNKVEAQVEEVKAQIDDLKSLIHEIGANLELQDQRNQATLDGYDQLFRRQDRYEKEFNDKIQDHLRIMTSAIKEVLARQNNHFKAKE